MSYASKRVAELEARIRELEAQIARAFEDARDVAGKVNREFVARRAPGRIVREISNYYLFLMEQGTPFPQR